jgi:hypothetical protein
MTIAFSFNISKLNFEPCTNRRTVYASLKIGKRTYWLQRWDTGRCTKEKLLSISRDGLMCWTRGRFTV